MPRQLGIRLRPNWTNALPSIERTIAKINSDKLDYCPFIDEPRKVFYYTSEKTSSPFPRMKTLDELKYLANNSQNGFGDIYTVALDSLFYY